VKSVPLHVNEEVNVHTDRRYVEAKNENF